MISFSFIILSALIAIGAYLITPDRTPMANRQQLELSMRKPGFKVQMLKVKRNTETRPGSFLSQVLSGKYDSYEYIPIDTIIFSSKYFKFKRFTGSKDGLWDSLSTSQIVQGIKSSSENQNNDISSLDDSNEGYEQAKSQVFWRHFRLGTDSFGRDLLSRLIIGTRVSLSVGLISVLISLLIGISLGAMAGYFKGWVDDLIVWLINVVWSIPTLLLVIAITFALGKGFWQVFIAVGLTMWVEVARVVRGQVLSIREKEFVEAARALGYKHNRIIIRHILPNVLAPVIVISAANFASAILIEAGLSFLGIGVQPPTPSWGSMIRENYAYIILDKAYLAILPGLCIMLLVLAFMLMGNALRDALDVRTQSGQS